ncbi:exopolyphosphatase [Alkalispirochaeta sphaeroplastigenens]|uniref:Exopolyphosphatase n=1 Tax=Alkalispirochaeta sphaeroplastigenens TaxID=1187066 RepID=A0A2S4K1Q5_9SPIO|nr:exopolyphosphatase [Alkalispirochaeta sphaeroplastigenens]POR05695.1 exopolyphosphatase [Alkalispirochaeta sphaeroplastigenens]
MESGDKKFRLVTRSDFDGLVCAVLLRDRGLIDEIKFVHPKDMQDGLIAISGDDITTNLPYVEGVYQAFDHHYSESVRVGEKDRYICDPSAPSTARVVYNHFGGEQAFPSISEKMMIAVDKGDSADFTMEEVLNPQGWNLLNFIMDARTGLGRFRNFRISNYQLMMDLIDYCRDHDIDDILGLPDVAERVDLYQEHRELFQKQLRSVGRMDEQVLVVDMRTQETIYAGNRFVKYALFPESTVSVQILWGFKRQNTVLTVGKSIFHEGCTTNIGELMLSYGGGGHVAAGTCQVANDDAERVIQEVVAVLQES